MILAANRHAAGRHQEVGIARRRRQSAFESARLIADDSEVVNIAAHLLQQAAQQGPVGVPDLASLQGLSRLAQLIARREQADPEPLEYGQLFASERTGQCDVIGPQPVAGPQHPRSLPHILAPLTPV